MCETVLSPWRMLGVASTTSRRSNEKGSQSENPSGGAHLSSSALLQGSKQKEFQGGQGRPKKKTRRTMGGTRLGGASLGGLQYQGPRVLLAFLLALP